MSKPIAFGLYVYETMKECSNDCREKIATYSAGDTLSDADQEYFKQLFTLHPEYHKKKGCGIKSIVYDDDGMGNNCLWVIREDDSKEDISWRKCVRPHTQEEIIEIAFKRAVTGNIAKVGTDERLAAYRANSKFKRLLSRFLKNNRTDYKKISVVHPTEQGDPRPLLADHWLAAEWYVFYEENQLMLA